jgi:DNA repair protein RecN (Recombination protein N)
MLVELNIKHFAIIDELTVSFIKGLNVISGETGAGKSIIIGAVSLLLGDRASADMIRSSEDSAVVEALFDIRESHALQRKLRDMGFDDGDELMVRRVISRSGKNRVYINSHLATLGALSAIGEALLNICGQHEHQMILNADHHVDILDEFGGLLSVRSAYAESYGQVQVLQDRIRSMAAVNEKRAEREEFLRFQLKEIADAGLTAGEDALLHEEKKRLSNYQRLMESSARAHDRLYGKSGCVLEELRGVIAEIREIRKVDATLALSEQDLENLYYPLEDAALILRDYGKHLTFDPARLETVDDRLELMGRLKRKYGGSLEAVLARQTALEGELEEISFLDEELERFSGELAARKKVMEERANLLSRTRRDKAALLDQAVEKEIHDLNMSAAKFQVRFRETGEVPHYTERGVDNVEFYLSTNVGESLKPLNRIASGGELSRIMLAMKKVLARSGSVGTIVFDEVDSGIGGATAEIVGEKLRDVARNHQVLCITHLPQIACFGDRHYRVAKVVAGGKTSTCVSRISGEERLDEMTRMLGGVELTEKTREHAREMLEKAGRKGM